MKKKSIDKKLNWTEDSINALGVYKIITRIMCLWPLESRTIFWKIRVTLLIIFLILSCIFVSKEMLEHCGSMKDRILLSAHLITSVTSVAKIVILNINRKNLSTIITNAVDDWEKTNDVNLKKIMNRYALINRTLLYMMLSPALLYVIKVTSDRIPYTLIIDNVTVLIRTTPLSSECSNYADAHIIIYIVRFSFRVAECFIYNLTCTGLDSFFFLLAMHLCSQLEILNIYFRQLIIDEAGVFMKDKFCKLIARQQHLYYLLNILDDSFNLMILIVLISDFFYLSIMAFTSLFYVKEQKIMEAAVISAAISLNVSIELFLYCFVGEKLTNEVDKSSFAMYSTSWYNLKTNVSKNIIFVILKCSKEFRITGGKLFQMNLENFKTIVKTLGSFFSVIRLVVFE
ncbi:odorant receptor 4-like [Microplitis mediator]|uniref:odorant receptor 4-like n=1 Tax=Microplitis mediator TaxID=375433 RepID=UPI0025561D6D|nr:odorant receptor 4-like [Microplitis mediator]